MEDIYLNCDSTFVTVDLTGGFKSGLLLYLIAKEINDKGLDAIIVPCVTRRINTVNEQECDRPDSTIITSRIIDHIKSKFPSVKFYNSIVANVDFWWYTNSYNKDRNIYNVTEKSLLNTCFNFATKPNFFEELNPGQRVIVRNDVPKVINYNAYVTNRTVEPPEYLKHTQKHYPNAVEISIPNGKMFEFYSGEAMSILPFYNIGKTELVKLAKDLNILDDLETITYTCEQSTVDITPSCGKCFNCIELEQAKESEF